MLQKTRAFFEERANLTPQPQQQREHLKSLFRQHVPAMVAERVRARQFWQDAEAIRAKQAAAVEQLRASIPPQEPSEEHHGQIEANLEANPGALPTMGSALP